MSDVWGVLGIAPEGASVTFERRYAVAPDDLWSAVTAPERIARWLGPVYGELRPGGRYELRMGDDLPGADQNAAGDVVACDPPHRFEVTWLFPGETQTRVEVTIDEEPGGSLLRLVHSGLEESGARGYGGGWHASLDQLGDHVAGVPVRDWQEAFEAALPHYRG